MRRNPMFTAANWIPCRMHITAANRESDTKKKLRIHRESEHVTSKHPRRQELQFDVDDLELYIRPLYFQRTFGCRLYGAC